MSDESTLSLAKRYCKYLGLNMKYSCNPAYANPLIAVWPEDTNRSDCFYYYSWDYFFFGDDEELYHIGGLCRSRWPVLSANTGWSRIKHRIIEASCLDELELQLSIRGF